MKKLILILSVCLLSFGLMAQSNYTYKINGQVYAGNTGLSVNPCYLKSVGTPSVAADSVINFSHYAFADRYQSIIYFLNKESEYVSDSIPPGSPTEGYIRFVIQAEEDDQGVWASHVGEFACYTSGAWKYYPKVQQPFAIYGLKMYGKLTTCYKLDATCFRNTILEDLKNDLGISNIEIIADPEGNCKL